MLISTRIMCYTNKYLGSFWDNPLRHIENRALLEREKRDLLSGMPIVIFSLTSIYMGNEIELYFELLYLQK